MFVLKTLAVASAVAMANFPSASTVFADLTDAAVGGTSVVVNVNIDGTYFDDAGTRVRVCPDGYRFEATTNPGTFEGRGDPNARVTRLVDGVEQVYFFTFCQEEVPQDQFGTITDQRNFWVGIPDMEAVVPEASRQVEELVNPPIVSWPTMDREFGWLYANTAMEFRVAALTPVTATVTLENILGSVTATATATPVSVTFLPGEPGGSPVTCSVYDAVAGFSPDVIGACTYRYTSSSAVAPNGREFDARVVVNWVVTGDVDPDAPTVLETYTDTSIAVAEIQAIVCSDGGC